MNRLEQTRLLDGLHTAGIMDCYLWKGALMVLNEYDKEQAELWLIHNNYRVDVYEIDNDMDSMIAYG